jgi:hypothetical protein
MMNFKLAAVLAFVLVLIQAFNGYFLCETKLYTPLFTYWLIVVLVMVSLLALIIALLIANL